jgi:autotransporter-associated beta strand protein
MLSDTDIAQASFTMSANPTSTTPALNFQSTHQVVTVQYNVSVSYTPDSDDAAEQNGIHLQTFTLSPGTDGTVVPGTLVASLSGFTVSGNTFTDSDFQGVGSSQSYTVTAQIDYSSKGVKKPTLSGTIGLTDGGTKSKSANETVTLPAGSLDLLLSDGTPLPTADKQTPGGDVALNDDFDNGTSTEDLHKDYTPAEDDLVPLVLSASGNGGRYQLEFNDTVNSQEIKIWTAPDKSAVPLSQVHVVGGYPSGATTLTRVGSDSTIIDASTDTTLYIEGVKAGSDTITLRWRSDTGNYGTADKLTVNVLDGELDIVESDGTTELNHDTAGTTGGYVLLNNDNDNYTFDANGNSIPDTQKTNVVGEHDLMPLQLHAISDPQDFGDYTVQASSGLKLWYDTQKTDPVNPTDTFDSSEDETIYVEGVTLSTTSADQTVTLSLSDNGFAPLRLDQVKYTVWSITGPQDVPGYSSYDYVSNVPGGAPMNYPTWTLPGADGSATTNTASPNTATVHWSSGPLVGQLTCNVAPGFSGTWDVNVVQIQISTTPGTNTVTERNGATQEPGSAQIHSTANSKINNIAGQLTITVVGPMVNGNMRGVKFMQMGFIQNVEFTERYGDFNTLPELNSPNKGRRRISSLMDGAYHIDYLTSDSNGNRSTSPWYDSNNVTGEAGGLGTLGVGQPLRDATINNQIFDWSDIPSLSGSDQMTLTENNLTGDLSDIGVVFDAYTYFAVATTWGTNGNTAYKGVYTVRASAHWTFTGTGTFANRVWKGQNAGTTGPNSFTEVTDGSTVPVTTGSPANDLFLGEQWTTQDKDIALAGALNITAGQTFVATSDGDLGDDPNGQVFLNGGTLEISGTTFTATSRTIVLGPNGGTILIDDPTNSFAIASIIEADGTLTKDGDGTLVLSADFNTNSLTTVNAGILEFSADNSVITGITGDGELVIDSGATLTVTDLSINTTFVYGTLNWI